MPVIFSDVCNWFVCHCSSDWGELMFHSWGHLFLFLKYLNAMRMIKCNWSVNRLKQLAKDSNFFSVLLKLAGGYWALAERTNQPHNDILSFFPGWRLELLISPAHFTRWGYLWHVLDTTGEMPGIWQRWQNHGKVMTRLGFKPGTFW